MSKIHHSIPVGMWAMTTNAAMGGLDALVPEFESIYNGDAISTYQACNHVQSYGLPDFFGLGHPDTPQPPYTTVPSWNAYAWREFVTRLETANGPGHLNGGNLKAIISRPLMGLRVERGWTQAQIEEYVTLLCDGLSEAQAGFVAGWLFDDEGETKPGHTKEERLQVVRWVYNIQKNYPGCANWAFCFSERIMDYLVNTGHGWEFVLSDRLKDTIGFFFTEPDLAGAIPILMPDYFPWGSPNDWNYTVASPWERWKEFMELVDATWTQASYSKLQFQPVGQASQQDANRVTKLPGHADMHKQIRVFLSLPRVTGIWMIGWNYFLEVETTNMTKGHWTQAGTHRYAEALQNEVELAAEGFANTVPTSYGLLQNSPNPFTTGTRIPYRLPSRTPFRLEVYNASYQLVKVIDEGYSGNTPQGAFYREQNSDGVLRLPFAIPNRLANDVNQGTSAYWDGKWGDDPYPEAPPGFYTCRLMVREGGVWIQKAEIWMVKQ